MDRVIALDPGRMKCGLAVFEDQLLIRKAVLPVASLQEELHCWYTDTAKVLVGDRTGSRKFISELHEMFGIMKEDVVLVDEHRSTMEARRRYWQDNPPRGWRRLLPTTMQEPPVPVDDYVAVILAERYFQRFRSN